MCNLEYKGTDKTGNNKRKAKILRFFINRKTRFADNIGVWCNGNTTDSGPVILGSSPSTPT